MARMVDEEGKVKLALKTRLPLIPLPRSRRERSSLRNGARLNSVTSWPQSQHNDTVILGIYVHLESARPTPSRFTCATLITIVPAASIVAAAARRQREPTTSRRMQPHCSRPLPPHAPRTPHRQSRRDSDETGLRGEAAHCDTILPHTAPGPCDPAARSVTRSQCPGL